MYFPSKISKSLVLDRGKPCPPWNIWQCLETFALSQLEEGCYWHLEGSGLGCCCDPQHSPNIEAFSCPGVFIISYTCISFPTHIWFLRD